MSEIQSKLQQLMRTKGVVAGSDWRVQAEEEQEKKDAGEYEIAHIVPGEIIGSEDDAFYRVRTTYPLDTLHGHCTLGDALNASGQHIALSANDDELLEFDPLNASFIDTETTGLMGGTGTVTFLVGVGFFENDQFILDQCFMRDYDDEEAMLHYLGDLFKIRETIVSYNGKSFDMPLLRTRFISNRVPFRLEGAPHYDLVHAARRFWKKRLGDCSLGNIERHIMGIRREGDVPSAEIPQIWLKYLNSRDARKLEPVFYHHKMDILSLAALTGHLSQSLDAPLGEGFLHHEDRLSLIRIHFKQKKYTEVLALGEHILDSIGKDHLRHECLEMLGFAAKRTEQWVAMEHYWDTLIGDFPADLKARHELAKHMEHRRKDLRKAAELCRNAIEYVDVREATGSLLDGENTRLAFTRRLERLDRKMNRK
jgi:hypothetical protein